ncbi:acyl carrier protein [Arenicella xantha]|uniref:Phosphopantetheine binding protein n=1 Tax=Arenicella xantha TaxID=644221 RepID=A0A395JMV7_9GAMM|nr:acyl carrier protein [Arenicella xantha]RBP52970.1 phosphopantetheine binding protein [Arenicella xantha]
MIKASIKEFLLNELCPQYSGDLDDDVKLISDGLIDSISALQLVDFIEKRFNIEFEAHEVDRENLDTLSNIERFIVAKQ